MLGYSTRYHKFKRLEPHFQIAATRSGLKEITETAVALPHSHRSPPRGPYLPCQNFSSKEKSGARAELRDIVKEKFGGRGVSSCGFVLRIVFFVGDATCHLKKTNL